MSLITITGSLGGIIDLLKPNGHMIYAGLLVQGLTYKIYVSAICTAELCIGIGLIFRRKWSYVGLMAFFAYGAVLTAVNAVIATDFKSFIHAGWIVTGENLDLFGFLNFIGTGLSVLMMLWLQRYRGEFIQNAADRKQRKMPESGRP